MAQAKRAAVYFDAPIHRALRVRAASSDRTISEIVNDAVKLVLAEDAHDLEAFEQRAGEHSLDFGEFVKSLKRM